MSNQTDNPWDGGDPLARAHKRLPTDIAPALDLWPGVAAAIAAEPPAAFNRTRAWTLRIAAGVACVALGAALGYGVLVQRFAARVAPPGTDTAKIARQVDSWLVKPVMLDAGYQKARAQLAGEFFRRIATLPTADRAKVEKGLREIEDGLRDLNDALKSNPNSILLQQLALSAYQQELEYMQNVTSLTETVPESTPT